VICVDPGAQSVHALRLSNDVLAERGFSARFNAADLNKLTAGDTTFPQDDIQAQGAAGYRR
jgi:hypothetical protein